MYNFFLEEQKKDFFLFFYSVGMPASIKNLCLRNNFVRFLTFVQFVTFYLFSKNVLNLLKVFRFFFCYCLGNVFVIKEPNYFWLHFQILR